MRRALREIIGEIPSGRIYKDGSLLIDAEERTIAARRRLAFAGVITIALAVSDKGVLMTDPEIELIGIPDADASGRRMEEVVSEAIEEAFAALPKPRRRDPNEISEAVRRAVRSAVAERWRKKPICHVHVLVV